MGIRLENVQHIRSSGLCLHSIPPLLMAEPLPAVALRNDGLTSLFNYSYVSSDDLADS